MEEILNILTANYFDISDASDNIGEKLLSTNSFMASIAAIMQSRIGEAVVVECITMMMGKY